jgi:ribosome maturation factor RimP
VAIESDQNVDIKHCVDLSHIIEAGLNREEEDYSLTVTSAGLDQPFKVLRQYLKFKGQEVEIVLKSGGKIVAVLEDATQEQITVGYEKLVKVEGKKKRERIAVKETYKYEEIKSTKPFINFR